MRSGILRKDLPAQWQYTTTVNSIQRRVPFSLVLSFGDGSSQVGQDLFIRKVLVPLPLPLLKNMHTLLCVCRGILWNESSTQLFIVVVIIKIESLLRWIESQIASAHRVSMIYIAKPPAYCVLGAPTLFSVLYPTLLDWLVHCHTCTTCMHRHGWQICAGSNGEFIHIWLLSLKCYFVLLPLC